MQVPRDSLTARVDEWWLNLTLGAIGEMLDMPFPLGSRPSVSLDEPSMVNGIALAARPNWYRLSIWTRKPVDAVPHARDDPQRIGPRTYDVGLQFKANMLSLPLSPNAGGRHSPGMDVEFQTHEEAGRKAARALKVTI